MSSDPLRLGRALRAAACASLVAAPAGAASTAGDAPFTVTASVDATRIGLRDTLELELEVKGTSFRGIEPPDLSDLSDFDVLDGPRRVQRQSVVNGRYSASVQFSWTLGPTRTGDLSIPPLAVGVDDVTRRTPRIGVQVVQGSTAARVPTTDRFGRRRAGTEEVRLVAEVDRDEAYVGQQITFTLRLLTQARIRGMAYQKRADLNGFWVEKEFDYVDESPGRIDGTQVVVDGQTFSQYLLARAALFPTASGKVVIDPINLRMRVRSDDRRAFQSFFFDREQTILGRSDPIEINVIPLPRKGRPDSFTGAVGAFRLEVATDRDESMVNEAVALRVSVAGQGNIRAAGEPPLPPLADFRPFDPTLEEQQGFRDGIFEGSRTWEYVLVPLAPGDQSIPPIRFTYFDPEASRYRTLRSDAVPLHVARGEGPELPRDTGLNRREVTVLRQDIHFIKLPGGELRDRSAPFYRSGAYLALLAMPFLFNAALLAWRIRTDRLQADVARRRSVGAGRRFRRALRAARRLEGSGPGGPAALSRALTALLADKFNLAAAGMTREQVRTVLERAQVEADLQEEVAGILDACDVARFAPGNVEAGTTDELAARVEEAARRLERIR